ncbi:hypothetical protein QNN00_13105 [Bacillus velezensis]|nr:hypothetical protein [Bacillus velezensis]
MADLCRESAICRATRLPGRRIGRRIVFRERLEAGIQLNVKSFTRRLHANTSTFTAQRFTSVFSGHEPFLPIISSMENRCFRARR